MNNNHFHSQKCPSLDNNLYHHPTAQQHIIQLVTPLEILANLASRIPHFPDFPTITLGFPPLRFLPHLWHHYMLLCPRAQSLLLPLHSLM